MTRAWRSARGRYIAILDGDDYWTDPYKLQKQVDYLEQHEEVFVCGHAVNVINEAGQIINNSKFDIYQDRYITAEGLVTYYGIPTLSMVFRNNKMLPASEVFRDVFNADTFMIAYFANFGGAYIMKEVMGTYRQHRKGLWTGLTAHEVVDHSHETFYRIPMVLNSDLRAVGYLVLLYHALCKDYSWRRKLTAIPYASMMLISHLRFRSMKCITGLIAKKTRQLIRTSILGQRVRVNPVEE
jgi:glycosyltransferase involved in cell wall biosynthesis